MKKIKLFSTFNAFSIKLSLFFMLILSFAIILMSGAFIFALDFSIRSKQIKELRFSQKIIEENIESPNSYLNLPYNIIFSVFNSTNKKVIFTNDSLLPLLQDSGDSAKQYFEKDFYSDGDLNIIYISKKINEEIIVLTAMNIDSDYATELFAILPKVFLCSIIPILFLSFLISVFITKKMTKPFERERQFSNDVSHELKTPLSIINGHASLLLRWGKDDKALLEESLLAIKNETKSMQTVIENLLDISRYESGRLKPNFTEFSIYEFYQRLVFEFNTILQSTNSLNAKINIFIEKDFFIKSDEELLHQIFTVLISNSLKFNLNNCEIKLSAFKKGKSIILEEEDNGIGIEEKILPHIFERFFRGDSSHSQNIQGSGLGLSIAQTLVNALDGKISAKNANPHGAIFRIEL